MCTTQLVSTRGTGDETHWIAEAISCDDAEDEPIEAGVYASSSQVVVDTERTPEGPPLR